MKDSTRWFGWIAVITALHMSEQLMFGIGELAAIKRILAVYYGWFQQPDYGTVVLVTAAVTLLNSLIFGILAGRTWREISTGLFGVIALTEVHHVIETIHARHYTPGTATALPFMAFGVLLLAALVSEHRARGTAVRLVWCPDLSLTAAPSGSWLRIGAAYPGARATARQGTRAMVSAKAPEACKQGIKQLPLANAGATVIALLMTVCALAQTPAAQNDEFVIRNARIFDGSRVIPNGDVWVKNGMIEAVGPRIKTPASVPAIDGTGRTLLPGLIDAHVHTMGMDNFLKSALALGVTTELDMGSAPKYADKIEREQAQGNRLDLADLRSSRTQPTAPDGHGTEYGIPIPTISSPAEAQALVDSLIAEGADFIGEIIYDDGSEFGVRIPTLSKETLRAVIEAAHQRGKLAVVHVLSLQAAKDALEAGADGLVHLFADQAPDEEFFSLAAQHRAFVIPTLSVLASISGASAGPSLARDPRLEPYLSVEAIADLRQDFPSHAGSISNAEEAVRRLNAEKVPILAGTDGHNAGTAHGASLHGELALLVKSGLTPAQALASATSVNAAAFQMNDRGQIVPGRRADLLLVDGDPTTRISDISNVAAVWKLGVQLDRETYRAQLNKENEAERAQALPPSPAGSESGLIADFEDGTAKTRFGLGWTASTGRLLGGHKPEARIEVVDGGAEGSQKALQISGEIVPGIYGWAGGMFFPGAAPMAAANLSNKSAISFWTKGDGRTYQVMLYAKSNGALPLARPFTAGPEWKRVTIPLSDFGTDGRDVEGLMIADLAVPGKFAFMIDEVRLESLDASAEAAAQAGSPEPLSPGRAAPPSGEAPHRTFHRTAGASTARAAGGGWDIRSTSYFWFQGIHGNVSALGKDLGFKATPADLGSRAKPGLQELVELKHHRLMLMGDILWTPLEIRSSNSLLNPPPALLAKAKYNPVIITPEAGYRLIDSRRVQIDGLTGLRYWHVGANFTLAPAAGGTTISKPANWVDPIVGARIKAPVTKKLLAVVWGDAGGWAAGSQLDYQIVGALSYQVKPKWALDAGWRYLYSDYKNDLLHSRVAQSGIFLGVTHSFKTSKSRS